MKKILFVAGSGGHTAQMSRLLRNMGDNYDIKLMLEHTDNLGREKFAPRYEMHCAIPIRGKNESIVMTLFRIMLNLLQSLRILIETNPEYIITTGPGLGIPICIFGKIAGKKIIVIESWSRTKTRSFVGKLLYPFANLFFVQWPQMLEKYPKAKFAGRLA